jgi:hypothetical protein
MTRALSGETLWNTEALVLMGACFEISSLALRIGWGALGETDTAGLGGFCRGGPALAEGDGAGRGGVGRRVNWPEAEVTAQTAMASTRPERIKIEVTTI